MVTNNAMVPKFSSANSYRDFVRQVTKEHRYVWGCDASSFLDAVKYSSTSRAVKIKEGSLLYRAQLGVAARFRKLEDGTEIEDGIQGYRKTRMIPDPSKVGQGRVNPKGISVLYLGSQSEVAISEVRPWVGSEVSIATFETVRELKALDLSKGFEESILSHISIDQYLGRKDIPQDDIQKAVWFNIDRAFSEPVGFNDSETDYVPTQILAELFRSEGYDALIYRSQFGDKGYNIAIFNVEDAKIQHCRPFRVSKLSVEFDQIG